MKLLSLTIVVFICFTASAQNKKPLTHKVYDDWKSIGERAISNNGAFVVYTITPQEGDATLVIKELATSKTIHVRRGYSPIISNDNQFVFCKIKPPYQDTRQAKIKKKKADEMPKDSLAIIDLGTDSLMKIALVKSFKAPQKGSGWVAYLAEKNIADSAKKKNISDSLKIKIDGLVRLADSVIRKSLDSVKGKVDKQEVLVAAQKAVAEIYKNANDTYLDAEADEPSADKPTEGTDLTVKNLQTGLSKKFKLVSEYYFDKQGSKLAIKTTKLAKDSNSKAYVIMYNLKTNKVDTIMAGFSEAKNFVFSEDGAQCSFVAERDSVQKALQKFYKLWYYNGQKDSATLLADKSTVGIAKAFTISEHADLRFSKSGEKLFFGTAPITPAKDTTLVEFELAKLDVWTHNDDYLQPQQLKQLPQELKRSYTAVMLLSNKKIIQLGSDSTETITLVNEGDTDFVLAQSTKGNRLTSQWEGKSANNAYVISTVDGTIKTVAKKGLEKFSASPMGKYIFWYNPKLKNYFTYNVQSGVTKNISAGIKLPLYDTENDVPDYADAVGNAGFTADDTYFLIQDEFDIWLTDPNGIEPPKNLTNSFGRKNKISFSYINTDTEKRFINNNEKILLRSLNKINKQAGFYTAQVNNIQDPELLISGNYALPNILKAKDTNQYVFTKSSIAESELHATTNFKTLNKLTNIATQQKDYNWLTAELMRWKMFDGKMSEGILYKPENFDATKKYPVVFYFYERNADLLHSYKSPAPSASTINIPYFVSNGYIVFDPNIYYKTGEPGQSAYNSVVSAAKMLAKLPWIDSTRMGIQGQSWGGYQVAYLVTKTNMFKAAGAGAPVSNMTSAYGGIRWGTGINRQFQYEKSQSRIGATLWQRQDLYIKNSPLFTADKIQTPLLIMHNDADGAVPWYQGIELFTAMKRLQKKVWLLQYNNEDHNLVERKNRKDLSIRLSQFFDYYLKDAPAADWIKYGVPATSKGINWGLGVDGKN
jgi:dipeptidyl aminopeptidase/acylaminoacyl peptidase